MDSCNECNDYWFFKAVCGMRELTKIIYNTVDIDIVSGSSSLVGIIVPVVTIITIFLVISIAVPIILIVLIIQHRRKPGNR